MKTNRRFFIPVFLLILSLFSLESCVVRARPAAIAVNPAPAVAIVPARPRRQKVVVVRPIRPHRHRAVIIRR